MSLNIKSSEAERLARELAGVTGETLTGAVTVALRERLDRVQRRTADETDRRGQRIRAIAEDAARRWKAENRDLEHGDLLYDDRGLPR